MFVPSWHVIPIPGKLAVFKAKVVGDPEPVISWGRASGEVVYHPDTCMQKYDKDTGEHTIEVNSRTTSY